MKEIEEGMGISEEEEEEEEGGEMTLEVFYLGPLFIK